VHGGRTAFEVDRAATVAPLPQLLREIADLDGIAGVSVRAPEVGAARRIPSNVQRWSDVIGEPPPNAARPARGGTIPRSVSARAAWATRSPQGLRREK